MFKRGRKGRISNELVAASCAAILAVYSTGTWRTRDEAKRSGIDGEMRRPARPAKVPAVPMPAVVAAPVPEPALPESPVAIEPKPALPKSVKADAAPPPKPAVLSKSSQPATPAVASAAIEAKPEPAAEIAVATGEAEPAATVETRWHDGYFTGWGQSRHGDIQAFVRIKDGMIIDSGVATCETRYPCSVIDYIILQPIDIQGPDVDRVSRATESADAYYNALVMALGNAETGTFRSVRP